MPAGRPRLFDNPEELKNQIAEYFSSCDNRKKQMVTKEGILVEVSDPAPYALGKLAVFLECTRESLNEYSKIPEFSDTIKAAKSKCEADQEERLLGKDTFTPGLIFSLKNNSGWVDKTEVDNSISFPTGINVNFIRPDKKE